MGHVPQAIGHHQELEVQNGAGTPEVPPVLQKTVTNLNYCRRWSHEKSGLGWVEHLSIAGGAVVALCDFDG